MRPDFQDQPGHFLLAFWSLDSDLLRVLRCPGRYGDTWAVVGHGGADAGRAAGTESAGSDPPLLSSCSDS